jgi:predicted RNA binding protein YcfA (HicA-like mRNA interferase family)
VSPLPLCSSEQVIRVLERCGFSRGPKSPGSHQAFIKGTPRGKIVTVVVLGKREVPRGTLKDILERAHISKEQFLRELR